MAPRSAENIRLMLLLLLQAEQSQRSRILRAHSAVNVLGCNKFTAGP